MEGKNQGDFCAGPPGRVVSNSVSEWAEQEVCERSDASFFSYLRMCACVRVQVLFRWAAHVVGDGDAAAPLDGRRLCVLVENLTGRKPVALQPSQNLSLVKAAFETMDEAGLPAAALTCSPEEVASGSENAITVVLWELAQTFFIAPQFPGADGQWKGAMMAWCQSACAPRGVSVTDFHRSWQNGLGLLALLDAALQDPSVINIQVAATTGQPTANIQLALSVAQRSFNVPPVLEASELLATGGVDERFVLVYLALLHSFVRSSASSRRSATTAASAPVMQGGDVEASTVARQSLMRAMAGRPEGVMEGRQSGAVSSEEIMRVTALIEELRDPINNVAEVLSRGPGAMGEDEAKATFKQLTERMKRLVEVLPDTLQCTQEAQQLEESIQAELRKVRARAEFEEAYIARLVERQRQTRAMSQVLQQNTCEQMELLRAPLLELLRIVDSKEKHLKTEIIDVERDKISILAHSQKIAESDLERMRTAEAKADAILRTKIVSVSWLETGHAVEDLLVGCEAGRIEGKSDFPESFTDFNCTLDLRLEHNVARACDHSLRATEFEERKVIQKAEHIHGIYDAASKNFSGPAALMVGSSAKDAMVVGGSRQSVLNIAQQKRHTGEASDEAVKRATTAWSMTVDGDWVRIDDADSARPVSNGRSEEVERVLAVARQLPPKEADEYLSQDFVRAILHGADAGKGRQSDRILQAALHESLMDGRAPPMGGLSGDYAKAGAELALQLANHEKVVAPAEARVCDGTAVLAIGGWDGNSNLHSLERLGGEGGPWGLVGTLSSSRRGLAAAQCGGKVYVIGGWDGTSYLSTVEVYDVAKGTWTQAKSMPKPRCFAAAATMGGKIYVAGGYYGSYNLETAEVRLVAPMWCRSVGAFAR